MDTMDDQEREYVCAACTVNFKSLIPNAHCERCRELYPIEKLYPGHYYGMGCWHIKEMTDEFFEVGDPMAAAVGMDPRVQKYEIWMEHDEIDSAVQGLSWTEAIIYIQNIERKDLREIESYCYEASAEYTLKFGTDFD